MRWLATLLSLAVAILPAYAEEPTSRVDREVRRAFLFAYPVYQFARTRAETVGKARADGRDIETRFGHRAWLATPKDRVVTTPNNDTLYSSAWLDLTGGPAVIDVPALPGRYHSVAMMSVFTDNFAVVGTRTDGGRAGRYFVTGPGWRGRVPHGATRVRAPSNDVWALVRVLVDGSGDLAAARAAQSAFSVSAAPWALQPAVAPLPRDPNPETLLDAVNALLGRSKLEGERARTAAGLAGYGIAPGRRVWAALPAEVRASWTRQLPSLVAELRGGFASVGDVIAGWSYPRPGMGRFGGDDFYRSAVALGGLAALPLEEAVYLTAVTDAEGSPLDGRRIYSLRIPPRVPVNAFWSLSMYEVAPDGRLFFAANPIDRYAVGNRTTDLHKDPDGAMTLVITARPPSDKRANWLPAPNGPFKLTFRGYLPQPSLKRGSFRLPGLARLPRTAD